MDEPIKNLESWTDLATKQFLQNIVNKKQKFDRYKKYHLTIMWTTIFLGAAFIMYSYYFYFVPYSHSFFEMFSNFVDEFFNMVFFLIVISAFGFMNVLKKKMDKYEDEYHALRRELVDKSKDLWKSQEAWSKRHLVFQMMKEKYDINLYHENK